MNVTVEFEVKIENHAQENPCQDKFLNMCPEFRILRL